jgi:LAO/AO transport system kinase
MTHDSLSPQNKDLLGAFREGKRIALARVISIVENHRPGFQALLHELLSRPPTAARIGLTGPPGAGKSTLVAGLATTLRGRDEEVGIVAVDPTSPYSGGALLGDRIRMNDIALDRGIFIRSMATRGSLGGLATTTKEVVDVMDAFGFPKVLLETVGVGQTELDVTSAVDSVVVVLVPESGDGVQAMKAGLMEIADIFVINKADRPGADRLLKEVRMALNLRSGHAAADVPAHHGVDYSRVRRAEIAGAPVDSGAQGDGAGDDGSIAAGVQPWKIPVIKCVAQSGEGIPELLETLDRHRSWLSESGELVRRRKARASDRIRSVVNRELALMAGRDPVVRELMDSAVEPVSTGETTPYAVAASIIQALLRGGNGEPV